MQNLDVMKAAATAGTGPVGPGVEGGAQSPETLKLVAAQFESMLLGQMLKSMRSSMFGEEEDKSAGFGDGPLSDTLYAELSLAISRAGGIGIGKALIEPMVRQAQAALEQGGADTTTPQGVGAARISSRYGWRNDPIDGNAAFHNGVDIAMPEGRDVPAAREGRVTFAGERGGYGLTVEVTHEGGTVTRYAHLSELTVTVGQTVAAGETLAKSGSSGRSTGPHLHFEVLEGGRSVDPSSFPGAIPSLGVQGPR